MIEIGTPVRATLVLRPFFLFFSMLSIAAVAGGCTREYYREQADRDVYAAIDQKTLGTPWAVADGFTIEPDPGSRLHDPSDPDYPALPAPGPSLYAYELPELAAGARRAGIEIAAPQDATADDGGARVTGLPVRPIPPSYWDAIPEECLARMLEFESVRDEYGRTHEEEPGDELLDDAPRLDLVEIVQLALLNSREYQTSKEQLYRAALALTLERYDHAITFTPTSGGGLDYSNARNDGTRTETMPIGSNIGLQKMLATGGDVLARFANNVVFTFDGPEGFSRDVSSELLFRVTQSVFQRDIRLNPLIQAERSLVYAARDHARFRKDFFFQLAASYYGLLRTYRNIEIESQNYFSLVRTFEQARAEVRASVKNAPNPVAVDQFEQGMLSGRSSVIATCNVLEDALDRLKLQIGLPTETPINIDLAELDRLTLRDEIEVASERVRRWLVRVRDRRDQTTPDRAEVLNADIFLIERLLEWLRLRRLLGEEVPESEELEELLRRFRVNRARVEVARNVAELDRTSDPAAPAPLILLFQRTSDVVAALLDLAQREIELARGARPPRDSEQIEAAERTLEELRQRFEALVGRLEEILEDPQQERLQSILDDTRALRAELEALIRSLDALNELPPGGPDAEQALSDTLERTDRVIEIVERLLESAGPGLPTIDIEEADAMATAIVQRLDLMNERGRLADDRRTIKIAADDLKSVLNLEASHSIRTRDNKPFRFSASESETRLSLAVDLPLNRYSQRNDYRRALIDYQAGRRGLMALEDAIKLDVRSGLRTLDETRIQYPISVTRAALAAEQVISVRLQLALGVEGVRGTDLLDALQSSREALIAVANSRIGYIVDRARFALDLELMEIDTTGFWPQIDDPDYQPEANLEYPENAGPTYGDIPRFLLVSREIREMLDAPLPGEEPETEAEAPFTRDGEPRSDP